MTDLITAEEAQKLLDGINRSEPRQLDYFAIADASPDLARTVIAQATELAQARAETDAFRMCVNCGLVVPASHDRAQPGPACEAPDACTFDLTPREAWEYWRAKAHQARADAQAAVALVAEKAARHIVSEGERLAEGMQQADPALEFLRELAAEIITIAPEDWLAEVANLRAAAASEKELSDAYLRIRSKLMAWDTKPGGVDRFEVTEAALDRLAAENAALQEQMKGLVGALVAERDYWVVKADADMSLFNTFDAVTERPRLRVMTEAMKKADALNAALAAMQTAEGEQG